MIELTNPSVAINGVDVSSYVRDIAIGDEGFRLSPWQLGFLERVFAASPAGQYEQFACCIYERRNGREYARSWAHRMIMDEMSEWHARVPFTIDAWRRRRDTGVRPWPVELDAGQLVYTSIVDELRRAGWEL